MRIAEKTLLLVLALGMAIVLSAVMPSYAAQCSIELPYMNLLLDEKGTVCKLYLNPELYREREKEWWDGILKNGDKIIKLNRMDISAVSPKKREEILYSWGRTVTGGTITLMRKGERITISLDEKKMALHWWWVFVQNGKKLEKQVTEIALRLVVTSSPPYEGIGVKFDTGILNPDEQQRRPGHVSGVVTKPGYPSPARDQGIKPGDRIAAINDIQIPITADRFDAARVIAGAVNSSSEPVRLFIERGDSTFETTVQKTKIFDGAGGRFFRNRAAIQKLDAAIRSLDEFESILFRWMRGTPEMYLATI